MDIHHTEAVVRDAVLRGCVAVAMSIAFHHGVHAQTTNTPGVQANVMAPTTAPAVDLTPGAYHGEPNSPEFKAYMKAMDDRLAELHAQQPQDDIRKFCAGDMGCEIQMRTLAVKRIQKAVVRKVVPIE